ncbi:MAG: CoB--CoM heterodisulfide reductase iron-sulfur subunit B family protein [Candidatus Helarchaeota archaeon]|nr:CoB--CoM heterodisulfide reductase iron-sulfur subunit B family protein [Candidatus Helarchaeota archaeon]
MEYLLFPGCKVLTADPYFEYSTKLILKELKVSVLDEQNFSCCGPTLVSSLDTTSGIILNARNICIGEERNKPIFTLCSWCFKTLNNANNLLKNNSKLRNNVNSILKNFGKEFKGSTEIKNLLQILTEFVGLEEIKKYVKKPLNDLKVVSFLGCHLRSQLKDIFDFSYISGLDKIIEITGAQNINYKDKYSCCGGLVSCLSEIETKFNYNIIESLKKLDVDAIIVNCPYCFNRFNKAINDLKENDGRIQISTIYLPDLIGLAMGYNPQDLALNERINQLNGILNKVNV